MIQKITKIIFQDLNSKVDQTITTEQKEAALI